MARQGVPRFLSLTRVPNILLFLSPSDSAHAKSKNDDSPKADITHETRFPTFYGTGLVKESAEMLTVQNLLFSE